MNNKKAFKIVFIAYSILMLSYLIFNGKHHFSDDLWFSQKALTVDTYEWLHGRFMSWSSRTPIEFALISTINRFWLWAVINSLSFGLLIASASYLSSIWKPSNAIANSFLILIIFLLMPHVTIKESIIWMTGSVNYLWPLSLMSLAYVILYNTAQSNNFSWKYAICTSLLIFLSSFNEQIAVINLIVICISVGYYVNKKVSVKYLVAPSVFLAIALSIILACPGNKARYVAEMPRWFPDDGSLSMIDKVLLGVNLYNDQLMGLSCSIAVVVSIALTLTVKGIVARSYSAIAIIISLIPFALTSGVSSWFSSPVDGVNKLDSISIASSMSFYGVTLVIAWCCVIMMAILFSGRDTGWKLFATGLLLTASASTAMMGLSPTIYGSGIRVLFFSYFLISLIVPACISAWGSDKLRGVSTPQT